MGAINRQDIIGRIITLQAIRYEGHYADCHDSYTLHRTACEYTAVINAEWTRFLVHEGQGDTIVFESIRYRNHYVDAHDSGEIRLTHSYNPPTSSDWARWRLVNVNGVDVIALESDRYRGSYLDCHDKNPCRVTAGRPSATWAQWRIAIGPGQGMSDGYEVVASYKNNLDQETSFKYSHVLGTTFTNNITTALSEQLSQELNANFSIGPLSLGSKATVSHSREWSSSQAKTWSEKQAIEAEVSVKPGKKLVVCQLQGTYGPLKVHSSHFTFNEQ